MIVQSLPTAALAPPLRQVPKKSGMGSEILSIRLQKQNSQNTESHAMENALYKSSAATTMTTIYLLSWIKIICGI